MGEKCPDILPKCRLTLCVLHAVKHGTDGFTSPPKEGVLRIFFRPKNPTVSAWCEPANVGTKGQHATSRPPKPLSGAYTTISTASGICRTVTPICRYRGRVVCAPDDGCRYHPKRVEQFSDIINCVTLHLVGYILEYILEYSYDARIHKR